MLWFKNARLYVNWESFQSLVTPVLIIGGLFLGLGLNQMKAKSLVDQPAETGKVRQQVVPASFVNSELESEPVQRLAYDPGAVSFERVGVPLRETAPVVSARSPRSSRTEGAILRVKDYVKNLEERNALMKEKLDFLSSVIAERDQEVKKLAVQNTNLLDSFNKTAEMQNKMKIDFEAIQINLNDAIAKKEAQLAAFNMTKNDLTGTVNDLQNKIAGLNGENAKLNGQVTQMQPVKPSVDLELALRNAQDALKNQVALNQELSKNNENVALALTEKENVRAEITKKYEDLKVQMSAFEVELEKLRGLNSDYQTQIGQLSARIKELYASNDDVRRSTQEFSSLLTKKELEKQLYLSDKEGELALLNDNLAKVRIEREALLAAVSEKDKALADMKLRYQQMESQLQALQNKGAGK